MSESQELIQRDGGAAMVRWTPRLEVSTDDALAVVHERDLFLRQVLRKGVDYGRIPGTDKDTLFKPGAERVLSAFGLHAELKDDAPPIIDLIGTEEHGGEPLIMYQRKCEIYRQIGPEPEQKMLVASASGACSSREKKYRWRTSERACPECHKEGTIRVSKQGAEAGDYYCWGKIGGCGAKFRKNDPAITGQVLGQIPNPDIADLQNTVLKMSDKRAMVAAAIMATGYSDYLTQDLEDLAEEEAPPEEAPAPQRPSRARQQAPAAPAASPAAPAPPAPSPAAQPASAPPPAPESEAAGPKNSRHVAIMELLQRGRADDTLTQKDMAAIVQEIGISRDEIVGWIRVTGGDWVSQVDEERAQTLENVVRGIVAPETVMIEGGQR